MVSHLLHVGVARSVEILPSPTLFRVNFGHQFLRQLEDGTLATDAQHAIVTIDEATGAFSCQSGLMDFAYTWHPSRRESDIRSEESRVGKEGVLTCRSRCAADN